MKTQVIAALTVGLGIGLAVPALQAQGKKPVYVCTSIEPKNLDTYLKDFVPKAQGLIKSSGGTILAAGQNVVSLDGAKAPGRMTVQKWESMAALKAYRNSQAFKDLNRPQYGTFRAFAIEGDE
jgi:uncharacterized protein (DUF1330 family)